MKRGGIKHSVNCPWFLILSLFNKITAPLGENSCMRNYFIDGKHGMEEFNSPDLHKFSWLENLTCARRLPLTGSFKKVRITIIMIY